MFFRVIYHKMKHVDKTSYVYNIKGIVSIYYEGRRTRDSLSRDQMCTKL